MLKYSATLSTTLEFFVFLLHWKLGNKYILGSHNTWQDTHPSQIFFTLFFSWSPWKKMMNTDLWTWSPCWKETVLDFTSCCLYLLSSITPPELCLLTVVGSSRGSSISAFRKKTFPRHTLHSILSNVGILSLLITPATNLHRPNAQELRVDRILPLSLVFSFTEICGSGQLARYLISQWHQLEKHICIHALQSIIF